MKRRIGRKPPRRATGAPKAVRPPPLMNQESLRLLFGACPLPAWVVDHKTFEFLAVNDAAVSQYGYTREEFLRMRATDIRPREDLLRFMEAAGRPHRGAENVGLWRHRLKDGRTIEVEAIVHDIDWGGRDAILGVFQNVTEHRRVERDLRGTQEQLSTIISNTPIILWTLDAKGIVTLSEGKGLGALGFKPGETVGRSVFELYRDNPQVLALTRRALAGETLTAVVDLGSAVLESRMTPLRGQEGRLQGVIGVSVDVTQRRRAERLLQTQAAAIKASMDGMAIHDQQGRFIYLNEAHARTYGYDRPDTLLGEAWRVLYDEGELARFDREIMPAFWKAGQWRGEAVGRRRDGSLFPQELSLTAIEGGGLVCVVRDITERRSLEQTRAGLLQSEQSARAAAEAASQSKDEFLALVSHELRTPMTAILGWTWLLRSQDMDPERARRALDIIERNMKIQSQIIDDLLDVSSIATGKLRIDCRPVDLSPILKAAADTISPAAEVKAIRVEMAVPDHPALALGDPDRLQQVFWNLLYNSVKYTSKGGRIKASIAAEGDRLVIRVEDDGQGMEPELMGVLFEPFRQGERAITRQHRGLGLGLNIVRRLIEMHGGRVQAASPGPGRGSTFTVSLPAAPKDTAPAPPRRAAPGTLVPGSLPSLEGVKVLIVDDEADIREMLKQTLSVCGAEVQTAGSTQEALQTLDRWPPDVLIADIAMPGEDGYALIRKIRARPAGGDLPAAALTACTRAEDRTMALLCGFQIYLPKPVDPAELAAVVRTLSRLSSPPAAEPSRGEDSAVRRAT